MTYKLNISPQAAKQRNEIVEWYETQSPQATDNFIKELGETFDKICLAPFRYRNTYKHFRVVKMKTYPYYVIYSVKERIIVIAKLYHTSRNPKTKYKSLK